MLFRSAAAAVLATSCASQPSPYLYETGATASCLRQRTEYAPAGGYFEGSPEHVELHIAVPFIPGPLTASAPQGTKGITFSFLGPDRSFFRQFGAVLFLSSDVAARRLQVTRHKDEAARRIQRRRNVVVVWGSPPLRALRPVLLGCLRTGRLVRG